MLLSRRQVEKTCCLGRSIFYYIGMLQLEYERLVKKNIVIGIRMRMEY